MHTALEIARNIGTEKARVEYVISKLNIEKEGRKKNNQGAYLYTDKELTDIKEFSDGIDKENSLNTSDGADSHQRGIDVNTEKLRRLEVDNIRLTSDNRHLQTENKYLQLRTDHLEKEVTDLREKLAKEQEISLQSSQNLQRQQTLSWNSNQLEISDNYNTSDKESKENDPASNFNTTDNSKGFWAKIFNK